jgi:predicted RNA polymerase sigma factor
MLLLSQQDRSRWDRALIKEGLIALGRAERVGPVGSYVIQAEIAACHVTAARWEETDFRTLVLRYDELYAIAPTPVVALNRAVAISLHEGAERGLAALDAIEDALANYHWFYATRADLKQQLGRDARADYERALALASNDDERRFLRRKLEEG